MKTTQFFIAAMLSMMLFIFASCAKDNELSSGGDDEGSGETVVSKAGGTKSHNAGNNCMNCHVAGGGDEGRFLAACTAYKSSSQSVYPNAVITLSTQPNGSGAVRATLYGDANGNFYTTAPIDFSGGLYPSIRGVSGNVTYMQTSISQGACNGCHGSSTGHISIQ